jgi:hypothetical protein
MDLLPSGCFEAMMYRTSVVMALGGAEEPSAKWSESGWTGRFPVRCQQRQDVFSISAAIPLTASKG